MVTTLGAAFAAAAVAVVAVSGFLMVTLWAEALVLDALRRVVDQGGHAGSGAAADERARDEAGDADPQPARAPRAGRPGRRPPGSGAVTGCPP